MRPDSADPRPLPDAMPFAPAGALPAHRPGEYEYTMPPRYQPFYPRKSSGSDEQTCIPLRDLPIIRTQGPSKYLDDACVPMSMVHAFSPDTWRMHDMAMKKPPATGGGGAGAKSGAPASQKAEGAFVRDFFRANYAPPPQFSLPLPFSGSPRMPAFSSPDGRGAPPPDVPPAPPVTYPLGHLPRKAPPLPMPELPPPQYPFG